MKKELIEKMQALQDWAEEIEEIFELKAFNSALKLEGADNEKLAEAYSSLFREMDLIIIAGCAWSNQVEVVEDYIYLLGEAYEQDDADKMQAIVEDMDILRGYLDYGYLKKCYIEYQKEIAAIKESL